LSPLCNRSFININSLDSCFSHIHLDVRRPREATLTRHILADTGCNILASALSNTNIYSRSTVLNSEISRTNELSIFSS
jgi:hypothetical protein